MESSLFDRRAIPAGANISIWTGPGGWRFRRFDWPAGTPRGSILFQGGRGDIFEKYLESFAHWRAQGWSITSLDWRGQGGSGRLIADPHVGYIDDFATYIADFRAFWAQWAVTAPAPRVLMGHSMGGHLVLRALLEGAADPVAAVLVAPMLGLHSPVGARAGEGLARLMGTVGSDKRAAWKNNERPATNATRQALLTHDHARYADEIFWHEARPEIVLGPPSWRWLIEAFRSTRLQRADPKLGELDLPILMLVADADKLVDPAAAHFVAAHLPDCTVEAFGAESAHEILREADAVRDRALAAIDTLLARF
ncbi:MAG: alpha/beta hydrolase [Pseudomonadota bacterium]|nr:alpha/beta hydrolase [Pseudomonadota bacterium]